MTDFTVNLPDGRSVVVKDVADENAAAAAAKNFIMRSAGSSFPGMETAKDIAGTVNTGVNWLGTQFTKGATGMIGMPAVLGDLGKSGFEYIGNKVGMPEAGSNAGNVFKNQMTFGGILQRPETYNSAVFDGMGVPEVNAGDTKALTLHQPLGIKGDVNLGKMLDVGAQAVPGAAALGTGILPAFFGGTTSEAAGQATHGTPWELPARIFGSLPGAYFGSKMTTPLPANLTPEQARLVQVARDRGIPMTVGQETGRGRAVESAVARFPTSQGVMSEFNDVQNRAMNRDMLAQVGVNGERLDPAGMTDVLRQGSRQFNAARNNGPAVSLDNQLYNDYGTVQNRYTSLKAPSDLAPVIAEKVSDLPNLTARLNALLTTGRPPELTSAQYQSYRKGINDLILPGGDSATNRALQGLRNALDDAMERSGTPAQAEAWRAARENWANLKILTKASAGGSMDSRSAGNVTPGSLVTALHQRQGPDRFATTTGGLNDSARLAGHLADTRPNSGTPSTLMMQGAITGGPIAAGYGVGGLPGAAAAAGGMALPNVIARAMTGQGWATPLGPLLPLPASVVRNYLANQALPNRMQNVAMSAPLSVVPSLADQSMALLRLAAPR